MASGSLAEASTISSGSFAENLFNNLPSDQRFKQVVTHMFVPRYFKIFIIVSIKVIHQSTS